MADPDLPEGVRQSRRGGANILFDQFFPKTAWKRRNFGPEGAHPSRPLDPSMILLKISVISKSRCWIYLSFMMWFAGWVLKCSGLSIGCVSTNCFPRFSSSMNSLWSITLFSGNIHYSVIIIGHNAITFVEGLQVFCLSLSFVDLKTSFSHLFRIATFQYSPFEFSGVLSNT